MEQVNIMGFIVIGIAVIAIGGMVLAIKMTIRQNKIEFGLEYQEEFSSEELHIAIPLYLFNLAWVTALPMPVLDL